MPPCPVRFLHDPALRQAAHARGENYWFAYIREVADQMGLSAQPLPRSELSPGGLEATRVLFLPALEAEELSPPERAALEGWVRAGGTLIGFATRGLDDLFGVNTVGGFDQPEDPWSCAALAVLTDGELARPLYCREIPQAPLPLFSPVCVVSGGERELARLHATDGDDLGAPAVSLREVGRGRACYFAFDLCRTLWALHQGRPIHTDRDGDGYLRMSDAIVIRPFRIDVPYADLLLLLLRNVVALADVPFIYPLPPTEGGDVPDALFYWGGDDEGAAGTQVFASDWMRAQGLPYHFNIMPRPDGTFSLSKGEFDHIKANGHETSLHFNFIDGHEHPYPFTEADIRCQVDWYEEAFGETPVCSVFHWCLWHGWSEPARWMADCGIQADNSRIHCGSPPINPTNLVGYSFGGAFPFWYWSDHRDGNRRLDFISEQITAYECGYIAGQGPEFSQLHRAVRDAAYYHFTMDFFFHPVNVTNRPECREAIAETLRYTQELGLRVLHMGNDELNHWWRARSAARIEEDADGRARVVSDRPWPAGYVILRRDEEGKRELGGTWRFEVVRGEEGRNED